MASGRGYIGTSGTAPNTDGPNGTPIRGPVVKQYFFVGGAEWLGPHNKHGALIAHAMFGGVYGNFQKDLLGHPPGDFDFYYNQIAPAGIIGGHFDLNRNEHWVFRITPDAVMTHYNFKVSPPSSAWGSSTKSPRSSARRRRQTGPLAGRKRQRSWRSSRGLFRCGIGSRQRLSRQRGQLFGSCHHPEECAAAKFIGMWYSPAFSGG